MPNVYVNAVNAAVTADSTAAGVITIASTTDFYPGAEAYLTTNDGIKARVMITRILSATTLQVREIPDFTGVLQAPSYLAGTTMAAFTLAKASNIAMPAQLVPVDQPTFAKRNVV